MRVSYFLATRLLVLFLICGTTMVHADEPEDGPRLLDASILEGSKQVLPAVGASDEVASEAEPKRYSSTTSSTSGRSSLSDRLQEIRRRAVDDDISRPFQVETEGADGSDVVTGDVPAVRRRSLGAAEDRTARAPRRVVTSQQSPTPATRPVPQATGLAPQQSTAQPVANEPRPAQRTQPAQPSAAATAQPTASGGSEEARNPVGIPAVQNLTPTSQTFQPTFDTQPGASTTTGSAISGDASQQAHASSSLQPRNGTQASPMTIARPQTQPIQNGSPGLERSSGTQAQVLMTNRAPALSFETAGPKTIKVGQEATYRVTMINIGEVDARNLVVTVQLPSWTEVTGHTASVGGPHLESDSAKNILVRWHISELNAKAREHLQLKIVPRDSRPFDLAVGWTFAQGQSLAQIEVQEPKLDMSISGPEEVLYGETDTYTITLSNPGTGDAEGVILQLLPLTPHQQTVSARKFGTLKAGERKTVALELTAHQAGRLQVQAVALADGGLRVEAGQEVIVRRAALQLAAAGPVRTFAGTDGVYRIRLENTGDATAQESAMQVTLPAGAKFLASNDGGKFDPDSGQVVWQVGSLRPGAVRVLEVRCTLTMPGENRFEIRATGSGDLSAAQTVVTHVEALADLKLFVNDPKGAIPVGADAIYEVKIVNRGTRAAEQIQVVSYFSEGIEPHQVEGWRGTIAPGQVMFEPIGVLAAGQELVFRITARALQPGNHVFRAEVQCSTPETKLAAEEWTKYYGDAALEAEAAVEPAAVEAKPETPSQVSDGPVLELR